MVPVASLWLPILVAAVIVFIVSSIIHTVLTYHQSDFGPVPDEASVRAGLRGVPAGDYVVPHPSSKEERRSEAFQEKMKEGPVAFMTVFPAGEISMGTSLVQWFVYCVLVGLFAAYVAGVALPPGADYLSVFQIAGTVAFAGYGLALAQNSIWLRRKWSSTLKSVFDALVYALLTAGTLGWLWPG
jgi:hypothetical protein